MNLIYETELYHHGVKGMKWGVRRAQKKQSKQLYTGILKSSKDGYRTDAEAYVENKIKDDDRVKRYKTEAKTAWKKYLDSANEGDRDYERTIRQIHKDPNFKASVNKLEKEAAKRHGKDTRQYDKEIGYGIDGLESKHPLFKEYQKREVSRDRLMDDAYGSSKRLADEIIGKYGNKKVTYFNYTSDSASEVVNSAINSLMMREYYSQKRKSKNQ